MPEADEEKEPVRLLYRRNKMGLVYIIIIVEAYICEVHHAVRDTFPAGYYIFQWVHILSSCF